MVGKKSELFFATLAKHLIECGIKALFISLKLPVSQGLFLCWLTDYLDNRKQRVVLPGGISDWTDIKAGVPQGSILGPLLFLLYINDTVEDMHSSIRLFADDTSLYIIVDNPVQAADQLNSDLTKIHQWANKWLVTFNPTKSESIIFSRKRIKPHHFPSVNG